MALRHSNALACLFVDKHVYAGQIRAADMSPHKQQLGTDLYPRHHAAMAGPRSSARAQGRTSSLTRPLSLTPRRHLPSAGGSRLPDEGC